MFLISAGSDEVGFPMRSLSCMSDVDGTFLGWIPSVQGSRSKWTLSFWLKRVDTGILQYIVSSGIQSTSDTTVYFNTTDNLAFLVRNASAVVGQITTTAVFRDLAAWYHIVVWYDIANATAADRMILYVNGVRMAVTINTQHPQNTVYSTWNESTRSHYIGTHNTNTNPLNAYVADFVEIDNDLQLPSAFAELDPDTNKWSPKALPTAGLTMGTCGRWYSFDIVTTDVIACRDDGNGPRGSGNGSNDATDGSGLVPAFSYPFDVPIDYNDGVQVRGNYATLNYMNRNTLAGISSGATQLNGTSATVDSHGAVTATISLPNSGKWYWEVSCSESSWPDRSRAGVALQTKQLSGVGIWWPGLDTSGWGYTMSHGAGDAGKIFYNNTGSAYGPSFLIGTDVIGVIVDMDARKIFFSRNNTVMNAGDPLAGTAYAYASLPDDLTPAFAATTTTPNLTANFGQLPFKNTTLWTTLRGAGYKTLCSLNLPEPSIVIPANHVDVNIRAGTGSATNVVDKLFSPGLVIIKTRTGTAQFVIFDILRGSTHGLRCPTTLLDETDVNSLTAFNADGFTLGTGITPLNVNASGQPFVDWMWEHNPAVGCSVSMFVGSGVAKAVPHGLSAVPEFVIIKRLNSAVGIICWHVGLTGPTYYLTLQTTTAQTLNAQRYVSVDATNVNIGNDTSINASGASHVMYAFTGIPGYSKFGKYIGNNAVNGPFLDLGFMPEIFITKCISTTGSWSVVDAARDPYNLVNLSLNLDIAGAEGTGSDIDFVSNGLKFRGVTSNAVATYAYMAWAKTPFKYANAR